jgi:hypothetical protein
MKTLHDLFAAVMQTACDIRDVMSTKVLVGGVARADDALAEHVLKRSVEPEKSTRISAVS